jgi:MFS family permease
MSAEEVPMGTGPMPGSMLRWYPSGWRARYGDEFAAMVEDDLGGQSPTLGYRWSIARSGLKERLRGAGLAGDSVPPPERVRGGAFTVLCAFAVFIVPGVGFAKISEHWDQSFTHGPRHLPAVSFNLLASLAGACGVAVVLGAVTVLPTFLRFLQDGGWSAIRRRVLWAAATTVATGAVTGGLAVWARHLTNHQRNAGFGGYQLLVVVFAILFAATVATWSAVAIAATRRLNLGSGQLKVAGALAIAVAVCMPVMTAAAAVWWGAMATTAPWFLAGTPAGSSPSPLATNLLVVLILMTIASMVGILGSLRVVRSWRLLPRP